MNTTKESSNNNNDCRTIVFTMANYNETPAQHRNDDSNENENENENK